MEKSIEKGKKYDAGKPLIALIEPDFLEQMGKVLTYGANKYGLYNWQNGLEVHRIQSALMRHYCAYKKGERFDVEALVDKDQPTELNHLAQIAVNAMFLEYYQRVENRQ